MTGLVDDDDDDDKNNEADDDTEDYSDEEVENISTCNLSAMMTVSAWSFATL